MKKIFFSLLAILFLSTTHAQNNTNTPKNKNSFVLGNIDSLFSKELNETRVLNIYLPEGYNPDSAFTYPVIYLLDGSADEDFIHIAGLVQFSSFPWVNRVKPSIVVGIANVNRVRDFTYKASDNFKLPDFAKPYAERYKKAGGSDKFIAFIEKELQPYVQKNYKANHYKTLIGQSLGGLIATEILLKHTHLFNDYIMMSPSLWWDNESLLTQAPALLKKTSSNKTNVYLAVGKEGEIMEGDAKKLNEILKQNNTGKMKLNFEYLPNENHGTILHQGVSNAFSLLYSE